MSSRKALQESAEEALVFNTTGKKITSGRSISMERSPDSSRVLLRIAPQQSVLPGCRA